MRYLAFIFLFFSFSSLSAQNEDHFVQQLEETKSHNPTEKMYLHTDRANYSAGETIWIKSYTTVEVENHLSLWSKIGYIELIDPTDRIIADRKIIISMGIGIADILLTDTLTEGVYRLRAYTNWMRNYDQDYFFEKLITVTNARTDNILTNTSKQQQDGTDYYTVALRTASGTPLSKKTVRYEVLDGGQVTHRGSERTDDDGNLRLRVTDRIRGKDVVLRFENLNQRRVTKVIHTDILDSDNSIQFLPEGGSMLLGRMANVGIKALKPNGKGIKATVEVVDGSGEVISRGETNALGIGAFSLLPVDDIVYQARVSFDDGSTTTVDLPPVSSSGYSLLVNPHDASRIFVQFNASDDRIIQGDVYLLAHQAGRVLLLTKQMHNNTETVFRISKSNLPTGLITLTVLDSDLKPLAERLVFSHKEEDFLPIAVDELSTSFGTRELVDVSIRTVQPTDSLELASLSASVVNLSKLTDSADVQNNILSGLLIESELKGFVEDPGYYFRDPQNIKALDLDHLLLTQGWRKFDWEAVGYVDSIKRFPVETGLKVSGQTRRLGRKAPASGATIQLISADDFSSFIDTVTSEEGYFEFDDLLFDDSTKFLLSAKDERGRNNVDIEYFQREAASIAPLQGAVNDVNSLFQDEMLSTSRFFDELERKGLLPNVIEIEEVVVTRERNRAPEHSRNLNGPGNADQVITWEDLETCPTLEMCLNGRLLGVMFRNGIPYTTRGGGQMQVELDGMPVEADMLNMLNPMDVASVEVLRNINYTSIYGSRGTNGVIVVTTKIGTEYRDSNFYPRGILVIEPKGISSVREFYKPIYDAVDDQGFTNDLRTTIHWEPLLVTDENGNTRFDFYTADESGTYRIIIEGIDLSGRLGRRVIDFDVD